MVGTKPSSHVLHQMFLVGGLLLTLAGIAFGWRALGESRNAFQQSDNAEVKLCEARVETGMRYQKIKFEFEKLVRTLQIGGFPVDKLPYYDSLWAFLPMYATNQDEEKAAAEDSAIEEPAKLLDSWLVRIEDLHRGRSQIEVGLFSPEIISELKPGFRETYLAQSHSLESEIRELEQAVKSLAGTQHEYLVSQTDFRRYAVTQVVAAVISYMLFFGGLLIFGRTAKNWSESIRHSEPATATNEATATKIPSSKKEVSASNEVIWFMGSMTAGLLAIMLVLVICIDQERKKPGYVQNITSRQIPKDFLTIRTMGTIPEIIRPTKNTNTPPPDVKVGFPKEEGYQVLQ